MTTKLQRVQAEFSRHAGETVRVEDVSGTFYAFGSELATLRLLKVYRNCGDRADAGYSDNMESHYFRLEFVNAFVGFDVPKC
jgi:hypothetical protein